MLLQHRRAFASLIQVFDLAVVGLSVLWATRGVAGLTPGLPRVLLCVVGCLAWVQVAGKLELYRSRRTGGWFGEYWDLTRADLVTLGLAVLAALAVGIETSMPALALAIGLGSMIAVRLGLRLALSSVRRRGFNTRNILFIGRGHSARRIAGDYQRHPQFGLIVLGGLSFTGEEALPRLPDTEDLGASGKLAAIVRDGAVDEVVIAPSDGVWTSEVRSALRFCETIGIAVRFAPDFLGLHADRTTVCDVAGVPTYTVQSGFHDSQYLIAKRFIDVTASALALAVLSPVLLLIAVVIKLTSPGPVLFGQTRVGLNGRVFTMYKFRSMVVDAEKLREQLEGTNEQTGPVFKITHDPRITRIGRILRKYSLDELPQLFNILKGDMSIVGPRPPIPTEVVEYDWWQRRRLSVRPGLTCIWQVSGRNNISFDQWMEMDLAYIDGWSLKMDLQIMAKTVGEVLRGGGV